MPQLVTLAVATLGTFLTLVDVSTVSVALPRIMADLDGTLEGAAWTRAADILAFAPLLLLFGKLADVVGRRRLFVGGSLVFAGASRGASPDPTVAEHAYQVLHAAFAGAVGTSLLVVAAVAAGGSVLALLAFSAPPAPAAERRLGSATEPQAASGDPLAAGAAASLADGQAAAPASRAAVLSAGGA